jgi:hypothetical protein
VAAFLHRFLNRIITICWFWVPRVKVRLILAWLFLKRGNYTFSTPGYEDSFRYCFLSTIPGKKGHLTFQGVFAY